ncbi:MAG: hemerythrin domain-containing protein [Polyangiales bacterium]
MTPKPLRERRIDGLMSPLPVAVQVDADLGIVDREMKRHGVGHVTVAESSDVVGIFSKTEVDLLVRLGGRWHAGQVVSREPYRVQRDAAIADVVAGMREKHVTAALVMSGNDVVGIVTLTDVIRAFEQLMGVPKALPTPAQVRKRILSEHVRIRGLLDELEMLAKTVVTTGHQDVAGKLRKWTRELGDVLHAHLDLEEEILLPIVRDADGFGPVRVAEMEKEHEEQRAMLASILEELAGTRSVEVLSTGVLELVRAVREDIVEEEELFLSEDLVNDTVMPTDNFGG